MEYADEQGHLHCANIRIKTREDYSPLAGILQHACEDDVQELIHVEVGGEFSIPGAILFAETYSDGVFLSSNTEIKPTQTLLEANLELTNPLQLNVESHMIWNGLEYLKHNIKREKRLTKQYKLAI